jgi:hypothetical protein
MTTERGTAKNVQTTHTHYWTRANFGIRAKKSAWSVQTIRRLAHLLQVTDVPPTRSQQERNKKANGGEEVVTCFTPISGMF